MHGVIAVAVVESFFKGHHPQRHYKHDHRNIDPAVAINHHQMLSTLHSSLAAQKTVQADLAWQRAEQQRQAKIDEQKARIREVYERRVEQLANAQRMRSNFSSPYAPPPPLLSPCRPPSRGALHCNVVWRAPRTFTHFPLMRSIERGCSVSK